MRNKMLSCYEETKLNAFKSQKALGYLHINRIMVMLLVYGCSGLPSIIITTNSSNIQNKLNLILPIHLRIINV